MRKIGGFDVLEYFLNLVSNPAILFITTWNLYSWKYLDEVLNIGKFFPVQINLPKFTASQIKESILSGYKNDEIIFVRDIEFEKEKIINFMKYPVSIKPWKKTIALPYFRINYDILKLRLSKKEERITSEDIIFEKIHRISNGNPGVAKIVWQKSLEYPAVKPGNVKDEYFDVELDYNEAFILNLILSMKSIKNDDLSEIAGPDFQVGKIIFRLSKQGLIAAKDASCIIRPEALKRVIEFLKKLRLVW